MDNAETAVTRRVAHGGQRPAPWALGSAAIGPATGRHAFDGAAGLSSLSYIIAALRRRTRVWCTFAVLGLALGAGAFLLKPPAYTAVAQAYLTPGPNESVSDAVATDAALAESRPVALAALHSLGLHESVGSLLASYTAAPVTSQVITISVRASSADLAIRSANALTEAFLRFRADQMTQYEGLVSAAAGRELAAVTAQSDHVNARVNALTKNGTSAAQQSKLLDLQQEIPQLSAEQASARDAQHTVTSGTTIAMRDSRVLNPAALGGKSRTKTAVTYALTGLIAGLFLGMAVIVVAALVTERLRVRDDIAHALGGPVGLSVGPVRLSVGPVRLGRLPWRPLQLGDVDHPAIQRIAAYLEDGLPDDKECAALAIVPADSPEVAALALVALALSCSRRHKRVMVTDLWPGAPAARLLGATTEPGVHRVETGDPGSLIVVTIPEHSDIGPTGPLTPAGPAEALALRAPVSAALAAAYESADILLTLADLEPVVGSDHLSTWADDAAVIVTAGRTTWTRLQALGEMIRLAHVRLAVTVVAGADQADDSLGQAYDPEAVLAGPSTTGPSTARRDRGPTGIPTPAPAPEAVRNASART